MRVRGATRGLDFVLGNEERWVSLSRSRTFNGAHRDGSRRANRVDRPEPDAELGRQLDPT